FSSYGNAFLADAIMMHRYVEIAGELRRVLSIVKVRGSMHSKQIRFFDVESDTITVGEALSTYEGILSDRPTEID
ncbi:MAG: protein kinase, partial [Proteobacteria bacterium]